MSFQNNKNHYRRLTFLPLIKSRRNPLLKRLKELHSRDGREQNSMLLLEGTHLLSEALKTSLIPIEIVATNKWVKRNQDVLELVPTGVSVQEVSFEFLEAALSTVSPDGVATLFPLDGLPKVDTNPGFVLALDNIQDPGNLGTLLRTALAAEIDEVWLACGVDPLNQKVLRASAGAILNLPFYRFGSSLDKAVFSLSDKIKSLSQKGHQVVATLAPCSSSHLPVIPYWELDWEKPTVLLLGNEGAGLHPQLQACCTHRVTLPHSSNVESLNVASAAVPMLLERRRSKMIHEIQKKQ